MSDVDFEPTPDPLLRHPSLAHSVRIPVLGIDASFETNSAYVLAIISDSFDAWRTYAGEPGESVTVRIVVHDGAEEADVAARSISTSDGRLMVQTPGSLAVVDPLRRESVAYVTTARVRQRDEFQREFVEAITFALLAAFDRHPVHAAALVSDCGALLLAAPSGTGKSTLAYLAYTAGIGVLTDDRVWVQMQPALRVWGHTKSVALRRDALRHFPSATVAAEHRGDKRNVAIRWGASAPPALFAERVSVCVLDRGTHASLRRLTPDVIAATLQAQMAPGFDRFPEREGAVLSALAASGGWHLTLSNDPRDALPFLREMMSAR